MTDDCEPETGTWEVQLLGRPGDLQYLKDTFKDGPVVVVDGFKEGKITLRALELQGCESATEVSSIAWRHATMLSAILKLVHASSDPLQLGAVYRKNERGGVDISVSVSEGAFAIDSYWASVVTTGGTPVSQPQRPIGYTYLQLAESDPAAQKALRLYLRVADEPWNGMYKILEVIQDDVGGVKGRNWASRSEIERFERTANSVGAIGDDARHGVDRHDPPPNPMSLEEAQSLMNRLLHRWLSEKAALDAAATPPQTDPRQ